MTGTEIVARANYLVDDEIDDTEALAEINLCLDDLSLEAPFEDTDQQTLAADTRSITVPSELISLIEVYLDGVKMEPASSPFEIASDLEGTPSKYYLLGDTLNFYPLNDTEATVDLLFVSAYTPIAALANTPNVPARFHMGIVNWLADKFKIMDDEMDNAAKFQGEYYRYRAALALYQQNRGGEYWTTREE